MSHTDQDLIVEERERLVVTTNYSGGQASHDDEAQKAKRKKRIKWGVIIFLLIAIAVLIIVLCVTLIKHKDEPNPPTPYDPFGYQERNPYNFVATEQKPWYTRTILQRNPDKGSMSADQLKQLQSLQEGGEEPNIYQAVNPADIINDDSNKHADFVGLNITLVDNYRARVVIGDANKTQYQVSDDVFPRIVEEHEARTSQLGLALINDPAGAFQFGNIYNGETVLTTQNRKLLVSEKYSEIGFVLPSKRIYGLGQHNSQLQLTNGTYLLWSKSAEKGLAEDDSLHQGHSGPHIHPFILCQTDNKDFFGIYFVGTAAQTFEVIYYTDQKKVVLNYITSGGLIEFYFIFRGTAQEIIKKYHSIIGYSIMPPYYALGLFQGSNAYSSLQDVNGVLNSYKNIDSFNQIPLEGIIIENYNNKPNDLFTLGSSFTGLSGLYLQLKSQNQSLFLGLDGALINDPTNVYYTQANALNALIVDLDSATKDKVVGYQGSQCVYLDFFNNDTQKVLGAGFTSLYTLAGGFDGIVFTKNNNMNRYNHIIAEQPKKEYSRRMLADENEENIGNYQPYLVNKTGKSTFKFAPFVPGYQYSGYLDNQTITLNAGHNLTLGGMFNDTEFYVHNANGHMALKRVSKTLNNATWFNTSLTNKRAFVFSESTFPGSGNLGGALLTNLNRTWANLRNTVSQVMALSISGISNVVSDTCGSLGPLDEELCFRWHQLSTFLPMSRNYYNATYWDSKTNTRVSTPGSEFYKFTNFRYQLSFGKLTQQRLKFSRYIYSQMYQVYKNGGALVRPLFFDYPTDDETFNNVENTFMFGDYLKITPALEKGINTNITTYFPTGKWFDLSYDITFPNQTVINSTGAYYNITDTYIVVNAHLKAGSIIPYQDFTKQNITTTELQTEYGTSFYVFRDDSKHADGFVSIDDGISVDSYTSNQYTSWKLRFAQNSINFWVDSGNFSYQLPANYTIDQLDKIVILDAQDLSGTDFACYLGTGFNPVNINYTYNTALKTLTLRPASGQTLRFRDISVLKFGNSLQEANVCNAQSAFAYKATNYIVYNNHTSVMYNLTSKSGSKFIDDLVMTAHLIDNTGTVFINITTAKDFNNHTKWNVPGVANLTAYGVYSGTVTQMLGSYLYVNLDPFYYTIHEYDNEDAILYQTDPNKFYFSDYLIFDSGLFTMNSKNNNPLMGIGERSGSLFYKNEQGGIHSRYAFDNANPIDDGLPPGKNMYGVQPMYQYQSYNTEFVGVFMLNSYAMDFILDYNNGQNTRITNVMIGGTIQKFFFRGNKPDEVITKYERLTGMPTVPPLWAFGWQQCRFGWVTDQDWYHVYKNYSAFNLPLDTMWADIDYMDDYKLFTISDSYSKLPQYVDELHADNKTFVPIMDAGVAARNNTKYLALDKGNEMDVWIKKSDGSGPLTAGVWCGNAYFPDFFKPSTTDYWKYMLDNLYTEQKLHFDGIWLDENEATNFCNGYCDVSERPTNSLRDKPYYVPGWRDLEDKALGVDGLHDNGFHEYDLHNLFALTQVNATSQYFTSKNKRPYVLSRSNFPGITKYGHTWLGDNWSTTEYMKLSVDALYQYQLFGLPFFGSDICGFNGNALPDLCTKWHQLGSLYPFSRNHNQNATTSQEPYVFNTSIIQGQSQTYTDLIRTALRNRYSFIRYYYSSFWSINELGGSFFKPLFFEYPNDANSYNDIQINILLGNALKASIQVTNLTIAQTSFYFPVDTYCQILPYYSPSNCYTGSQTLATTLSDYYIHIRQTYIIPFQNSTGSTVNTTKDLENMYTDLLVLPNATNQPLSTGFSSSQAAAFGYVYFDDGITLNYNHSRFDMFLQVTPASNQGNFSIQIISNGTQRHNATEYLGNLRILKASTAGLTKDTSAKLYTHGSQTARSVDIKYDTIQDELTLTVSKYGGLNASFWEIDYILINPN